MLNIKVNNIKFEIQPSFQLIYYWIEQGKLNIKPIDLVHKAKLEKKKKEEKVEKLPKHQEKIIHNRPEEIDENKRRTVVYYADPYSSWQKGMNENCNGILRRFIPKGTDLNNVSKEKLEKVLQKINGKPRKILGFISAEKRFEEEIRKIVS